MPRKKKQEVAAAGDYAMAKPETIQELDKLAIACRIGIGDSSISPFSEALGLAGAVYHLRAALSPEVMRPIMALQGTPLGFRTDRDVKKLPQGGYGKGDGYPLEIVRDCVIESCRLGARLIGNEFNIISSRLYLTKEFFSRKLDETIGRGNWRLNHSLPKNASGGAVITTRVEWLVGKEWTSETIELAIKGDGYSSSDQYLGKADRKAGSWLYRQVTGIYTPEGEADDAIDVTPRKYTVGGPEGAAKSPIESPIEAEEAPPAAAPKPKAPKPSPTKKEAEAAAVEPDPVESIDTASDAETVAEKAEQPTVSERGNAAAIRKEYAEIIRTTGAHNANAFLLKCGWIVEGQSFRDLNAEQIGKIVKGRDGFIGKCLGEVEENEEEL